MRPQKIAFSGPEPPKKMLRSFVVRIFMVPGRFWRRSNIEPKMERRKRRIWTRFWLLFATFFKLFSGGSGRSRGINNNGKKCILPNLPCGFQDLSTNPKNNKNQIKTTKNYQKPTENYQKLPQTTKNYQKPTETNDNYQKPSETTPKLPKTKNVT